MVTETAGALAARRPLDWRAAGCTLIVGVAYYLGARLGLELLKRPEGVAVFWPPSGIAAGAIVFLGGWCRPSVALGVFGGTFLANLLGDRNLPLAVIFGIGNACEAVFFAWLVHRWSGGGFRFADLQSTIWFFVAAAVSTALLALPAALAIQTFGTWQSTLPSVWREWWLSDAVGIVMFAPFLMLLREALADRPTSAELIEGVGLICVIVAVTSFTFFVAADHAVWWMPVPVAAIFPLLLWITARSRPIFLAASLMLIATIIVWATTNGLGHFGNPIVPLDDRVFAARVTLIAIAFCGLVLVAVFTELRNREQILRASDRRFQEIAATAPGMIYSIRIDKDGKRTLPYASQAIDHILGMTPEHFNADGNAILSRVHVEDLDRVKTEIQRSRLGLVPFHTEFRYKHPKRGWIWLEANTNPVNEPDGATTWHGFQLDISSRKAADENLKLVLGELNHRSKNLLAVVQAVAASAAREETPQQFLEVFNQRIAALAASHDLLVENSWEGASVGDLARSQLAHFRSLIDKRILLDGPTVTLRPHAAQAIGLALHELATNAAKYGAISAATGTVHIAWSIDDRFLISWRETGGPPATAPTRTGFGQRVLVNMAEHQLDADVRLQYLETGLVWEISAPTVAVVANPGSSPGNGNSQRQSTVAATPHLREPAVKA